MPKLKICGIKDEDNASVISGLDIDYFGLIFAKSPRQVNLQKAEKLAGIFHKNGKKVVGVFVDETLDCMLENAKSAQLDGVQIYKSISQKEFEAFKAYGLFVWQVVSVGQNLEFPKELYADMVLFDTKGKARGGNGVSFDWRLIQHYQKDFALAGGIGLENIKEALMLKPKLIDINSKVEDEKGLKDIKKIRQILTEMKR